MTTAAVWVLFAGLWVGCLRPTDWWTALAGAAVLVLSSVLRRRAGARLAVAAVALVAIGSGLAGGRVQLLATGPLQERASAGGQTVISGVVATDPRPSQEGVWFLVRVATVDGRRSGQRALVRLADARGVPGLGAGVTFPATARPLGAEGFDAYLRRLHAATRLDPVGPLTVARPPPLLIRTTNTVRARVRAAASRHLGADSAALLSGLVAGDTTGLSEQTADTMLASGLTHLVAVSGSNVALVLAGTVALTAAAGFGPRGRRRIGVAALLWFTILVRAEPSVLRATAMALIVIAAQASGRGHDARYTLAVAGMLLLLIDPMLAGQLGFSLSVLATAGVLVAGPAIAARVRAPRPLALLVGATVGAQLGVSPMLLATEGAVPLAALPANLVAVPAAAIASAIGVTAAVVAQGWQGAGAALCALSAPALATILWAGRTFADAPALRPQHLLTPGAVLLLGAFVARRRLPVLAPVVIAFIAFGVVGTPWGGAAQISELTVTALDVGQGDALLVEVPPGQAGAAPARMLVDAGPDQTAAVRELRRRGVRQLDAVVVSHPHADHTDGLPAVLSDVATGALVTGPVAPQELEDPSASAVATEVVATQRGVALVRVAAGQQFRLGTAVVDVLSPPADGSLGREPNDNSLVLRVRTHTGVLLLTGDAEEAAQQRLLRRPDLLRADVVKVPHHGGNTNAAGFLDAVGAHTAVIGVGADNTFGHPHRNVLADLAGTRVVRTDTDGTATVTVNTHGVATAP